jgi:predicted DNA-binding protein
MAQVNTSISDKLNELLDELSNLTGISKSSLIAEYVRRGIYEDITNETKLAEFKALLVQQQKSPTTEDKSNNKRRGKAGGEG